MTRTETAKFRGKRGRDHHELDLSEVVSKRSWTGRPSDQQREWHAQRYGAGLVRESLESNSFGGKNEELQDQKA